MAPVRPRVLTVPFGASFLDALAAGLLDGGLIRGVALRGDPAALAATTIFLPTRRGGAALADAIIEHLGGAALLPRILPLGEAEDEDDIGADADAAAGAAPETRAFPSFPVEVPSRASAAWARPIPERDRILVLARLVRHWAAKVGEAIVPREAGEALLIPGSPADAIALAAELARLIDSFATENVPWSRLAGLVPEDLDRSWQLITEFLQIAARWWPDYLAAAGLADRAALRNARLEAYAARLAAQPPAAPVIVAGSTGSNPATATLMAAVARLPLGAVVLPGIDRGDLDAAAWEAAAEDDAPAWTHPQHGLARTLAHLGIDRGDVGLLWTAPDWATPRRRLVAEALRPAATTEAWADHGLAGEEAAAALSGVTAAATASEHEEALTAAVLLRETLAEPGRRAALVTPDRGLARRVAAELARWGLAVEDSAGLRLSETPAGVLARLIADAAAAELAAPAILPLLKHPDATLGRKPRSVARASEVIEIAALRGPPPKTGADGLRAALAEGRRRAGEDRHAHPALRRIRTWE
ncbi:MAG TPA: double-strand break repair protein AddB, partial [Hyphomicrobiales bacterium]|nr:double-strand break repair protein AddB [Hyphomicrobiales bacterium]